MAGKEQVRLTGPNGTVVRVSEDEAGRLGAGWKQESKTPAKQAKNSPKK